MGKNWKLIDLTGERFDRLVIISRAENDCFGKPQWLCQCDCGSAPKVIEGGALRGGKTRSCGCFNREQNTKKNVVRHENMISNKPEYLLWQQAKTRAKRDHLPFNIEYTDIVIPVSCPVLGMKLKRNINIPGDDSPSVDKLIPERGYVKGNICVISFKANSIKRDATRDELRKVLDYVEGAFMHQ